MLDQVTYIQKFIMADSEDEFMPICVTASAAFVAMSQRICRPGVGRASAGRQYQTYLIPLIIIAHTCSCYVLIVLACYAFDTSFSII